MAERQARNKDSLKNLALGTNDDELFGDSEGAGQKDGSEHEADDESDEPDDEPDEPDDEPDEADADAEEEADGEPPSSEKPADSEPARRPFPELSEVEPLFAQGRWGEVCELLGPPERAEDLPPSLGLLYATARKEHEPEEASDANPVAIRAMAALLGTSPESQTAVIVAKRILRQNPASWSSRAAPAATARISIILLTIIIGAVVGWVLGPSGVRFDEFLREVLR
jgi:hypothetical protein